MERENWRKTKENKHHLISKKLILKEKSSFNQNSVDGKKQNENGENWNKMKENIFIVYYYYYHYCCLHQFRLIIKWVDYIQVVSCFSTEIGGLGWLFGKFLCWTSVMMGLGSIVIRRNLWLSNCYEILLRKWQNIFIIILLMWFCQPKCNWENGKANLNVERKVLFCILGSRQNFWYFFDWFFSIFQFWHGEKIFTQNKKNFCHWNKEMLPDFAKNDTINAQKIYFASSAYISNHIFCSNLASRFFFSL